MDRERDVLGQSRAIAAAGEDIEADLLQVCQLLRVRHCVYHLAPRMNPGMELPIVRATYGGEWIRRYILRNYFHIDPVLERGLNGGSPFFWSQIDISDPDIAAFFDDAREHGVGNCVYTVPLTDKGGRRAMFTVNDYSDTDEFKARISPYEKGLRELARSIHRKALDEIDAPEISPTLSPREIECLTWTARGKDATTVAEILSISDHTVRDYLKSAKSKLGCSTIAQAVFKATSLSIIRP